MIGVLTRRALRARLGRTIFIALAIALSVSFVSGSFILADSMKATFDNLFGQLTQDVDLEIRTELTVDQINATRDPVPAELVEQIAEVDGVAYVEGGLARYAQILDSDGEPVVKPVVRAACLLELASQYRFREGEGNNDTAYAGRSFDGRGHGYVLNKASTALLAPLRRPTVA